MTRSCLFALMPALAAGLAAPAAGDEAAPPPRRVLAFYYAWYDAPPQSTGWAHWEGVDAEKRDIASSTHYPEAGAYDSGDPAVINRHLATMAEAGIDGAIVSWWGPRAADSDRHMPAILEAAAKHGRVVSAYLEALPGRDRVASAADQIAYLVKTYGGHPTWLRVADRPVVFVYGRAVDEMGPLARWAEVRRRVVAATGIDPFLVGDRLTSEAAGVFDGLHTYNPAGELAGVPVDRLPGVYRATATLGVAAARAGGRGKLACATVIPGYDDTKIRHPGLKVERFDGATYAAAWDAARASGADWALITTWNEWHEGSEVEPSVELGDAALKATRAQADRFRANGPEARTTGFDETWIPLLRALGGRPVALLDPLPRGVGLDLLERDMPTRLLSARELRAEGLDPKAFPLLVYAGGEGVEATGGDAPPLDAVLRAYLQGGGRIVWASPEAWPAYRDAATGRSPYSARLGLALGGGFERPPAGGYALRAEGPLAELGTLPYPTAGDVRLRIVAADAAPGVQVTPLVTALDDDGTPVGIAAAELATPDVPGRTTFVACPVPTAFGPAFWPRLLAHAARESGVGSRE